MTHAAIVGWQLGPGTGRCLDCHDLLDHACVPNMPVLRNFEQDTATAAKRAGMRLHNIRRPTISMRSRAALGPFMREHRAMKIFASGFSGETWRGRRLRALAQKSNPHTASMNIALMNINDVVRDALDARKGECHVFET
jgi:hypothetical protein